MKRRPYSGKREFSKTARRENPKNRMIPRGGYRL